MASTQTQRKKRCGQLDIDDMERRIVEFRLMLDREKRRCQAAKMADKFEQLIRDKLSELNQETSGPSAEETDHMINLKTLDKEAFGRLGNFLRYTVDKCSHSEQHEQFQTVLRDALLSARRKITSDAIQNPASATGPLLEPFCYFCAGNFNSTCVNCCQSTGPAATQLGSGPGSGPGNGDQPVTSSNGVTILPVQPNSLQHQLDMHLNTPPPTAAPTPEVGEQARVSSEQQLPALTNGGRAETWARDQNQEEAGDEHPSMADLQAHFSQSFTSQQQQQQQQQKEKERNNKRTIPSTNASQDSIVPPSDNEEGDESSSSDESGREGDVNAMRSILSSLHASGGPLGSSGETETSQRRSSTPLSDAAELVIDEEAANRSQASTQGSGDGGDYGLLTTGRAPSPIASSSPRLSRLVTKTKTTVKKSMKGVKESGASSSGGVKFKTTAGGSSSSAAAAAAAATLGKGNKLEQVSERLRSSGGSSSKNGDKFARRKFQPKRRNNNNDKRK